jgi:hypothetical protein
MVGAPGKLQRTAQRTARNESRKAAMPQRKTEAMKHGGIDESIDLLDGLPVHGGLKTDFPVEDSQMQIQ